MKGFEHAGMYICITICVMLHTVYMQLATLFTMF